MKTQAEQARDARAALINVGVDFETYYDTDYSLRKMTVAEYIRDSRFEIIGASITHHGETVWHPKPNVIAAFEEIPWHRCRFIAHNAMFDGAITEWILGHEPASYLCTMMGSRPYVAPAIGKMSLDAVLRYLDLGVKGDAVHNFKGRRFGTFTVGDLADYGDYCDGDVEGSMKIAQYLLRLMPEDELDLLDLTIKKFTRPTLRLDIDAIRHWRSDIEGRRYHVLQELKKSGVTKQMLTSRPQFAELLKKHNVTIPMKASPSNPEEETFAFAKQDLGLLELAASTNGKVRELVEARLLFSSNQEASRLERFEAQAKCNPDATLPVPLLYYGAGPGRFSGYDSLNLQNLTRVDPTKPGSEALRSCLVAPDKHVILAADLSNIEARILATLAGEWHLVEAFRRGRDVYSEFATQVYGRPITKADKTERFVGKTCILGLGYGMGFNKFLHQMLLKKIPMDAIQADKVVSLYRRTYSDIPRYWRKTEDIIRRCTAKDFMHVDGPLSFVHERILLPNGMQIWYPGLAPAGQGALVYSHPKYGAVYLWGGHITENICQALARIVMSQIELRLARAGLRAALQVHDELVFVVPQRHVEACRIAVEKAMVAPVPWLPRLPVACEVHYGRSYAEAK